MINSNILLKAISQLKKIEAIENDPNQAAHNTDEIYKGIALLGGLLNAETSLCRFLPKGQIVIGTGEKSYGFKEIDLISTK